MNKSNGSLAHYLVVVACTGLLLASAMTGVVFAEAAEAVAEAVPVVEAVVEAAPIEAKSSLPSWLDEAIALAIKVLTPVILFLVALAAQKLGKKLGLQNTQALEDLATGNTRKAIAYADRWAIKKGHENPPDDPAILDKAIGRLIELEGRVNVGDMLKDALSKRIHTELGSGN